LSLSDSLFSNVAVSCLDDPQRVIKTLNCYTIYIRIYCRKNRKLRRTLAPIYYRL